ncbi:retropepsin-like aspartic protease [Flavobacterium sp. TAB 87]|uniref:retropepsin-like aspartic protease n=1 Tax=Flavobacterium sp. TAB 87 TaxID=1729581 RepID=UPI00076D8141|nr:retropepsin-like aspartic protease [Flavobacterium sp. TAB 87]KVV13642.1 putative aspartyl protease [Flavobacterium sp. TAB 87]
MEELQKVLKKAKYQKIKFKFIATNHLVVKIKLNGIHGNFILDTGASNTCVGYEAIERYQLDVVDSDDKAAGAGGTGMDTQVSKNNILQIGRWKQKEYTVIVFDMSHVNEALRDHKAKPVHGIIGADVLMTGKGIIDYYNHYLYLK